MAGDDSWGVRPAGFSRCWVRLATTWLIFALLAAGPARAVTVQIDYAFDTGGFFSGGNPDGAGAQAEAALEAAADFFSGILEDTLSPIQTPQAFNSANGVGRVTWSWGAEIFNPGGPGTVTLANESLAPDEYRVYAGGRPLGGDTLGIGGPGGFTTEIDVVGAFASQAEIDQITAIDEAFAAALDTRGQGPGEFARWGGLVSFDSDGSTNWHYDHTTPPPAGTVDFFSVAIHELAHALGWGTSDEWRAFVSEGVYSGPASVAANGGAPVPVEPALPGGNVGHWLEGVASTEYASFVPQETAMDPDLTIGERKVFTKLDAAALVDMGWTVADTALQPGDYNLDGVVDAADYTVWRDSLGTGVTIGTYGEWKANFNAGVSVAATTPGGADPTPEPAAIAVLTWLGVAAWPLRRAQRPAHRPRQRERALHCAVGWARR